MTVRWRMAREEMATTRPQQAEEEPAAARLRAACKESVAARLWAARKEAVASRLSAAREESVAARLPLVREETSELVKGYGGAQAVLSADGEAHRRLRRPLTRGLSPMMTTWTPFAREETVTTWTPLAEERRRPSPRRRRGRSGA
ncbi:hypothetical protein HTZ77_44305 [Nonomuraea sp. SMC257]|uniref:Cytochrome P450 n=1 Tax=Nonomuraea montanisoli TaxID=2741721 RepID=A0A7Y6M995_9ACTN|nr:hypothetical protein [Nonomuraea montanisoli]NUW38371.1 hypothetical protein [Nonomuraea montanisoli]